MGAASKSEEEARMLEAVVVENARELQLRGALGATVRTEQWDGVDHLVVPVVALQEGVIQAMNAPTPEFVPEDVLMRSFKLWNGLPIVLDHPKTNGKPVSARARDLREKQAFGLIRNAELKGKRLGMEVLVNPDRLIALGEEKLLSSIRSGDPVEVSVGVFARTVAETGTFEGKSYKTKWLEILPDHLAFLPRGTGACSLAMGCGANRFAGRFLVTASAFEERDAAGMVTCDVCDGTGQIKKGDKQVDCPMCGGAGEYRAAALKIFAGSRHSYQDRKMIQSVHDHSVSLGAECDQMNAKMMKAACSCGGEKEEPTVAAANIRHEGGKWNLYSLNGKIRLGSHPTKVEAEGQWQKILQVVSRMGRDISQEKRDKLPNDDFAGPDQSFPIVKPQDVSAAAHSLGRAKGNQDAIKAKIISIAYRKGPSFVAELPEAWKRTTDRAAS